MIHRHLILTFYNFVWKIWDEEINYFIQNEQTVDMYWLNYFKGLIINFLVVREVPSDQSILILIRQEFGRLVFC